MNFINHDEKAHQVNFLDSRAYTRDNIKWYPGVTNILQIIAKGTQFEYWLKSVGFNADTIIKDAYAKGSKSHEGIEKLNNGIEIKWVSDTGTEIYSKHEWEIISRYVEFFERTKPEIVKPEFVMVSDKLGYGGQIDCLYIIDGKLWMIDYKTGGLYDTADLQLAAYMQLWNEKNPEHPIEKLGILHLEATTRGEDKKGKQIQGKGWKLVEIEDIEYSLKIFNHTHECWKWKNPDFKPLNLQFPDRFCIKKQEPVKSDSEISEYLKAGNELRNKLLKNNYDTFRIIQRTVQPDYKRIGS